MKIRLPLKLLLTVLALFFVLLPAVRAGDDFIEGKHYQLLPKSITQDPLVQDLLTQGRGKIQVIEFFSYGCNWCFRMDPYMEQWRQTEPANVVFQRIPVEFHPGWASLSKVYFTLVDLQLIDKMHHNFFEALQTERIANAEPATLVQYFTQAGIPAAQFTQTYDSFDVNRKQKWAAAVVGAYRITAIPALIVQGPAGVYMTMTRMAGSEANVLKVANKLVQIQSQALAAENHHSEAKLNAVENKQ